MSTAAVAAEEVAGAAAERKASRLTRERVRSAWLFMAPMLVVLALVAGWPLARTIWFGFTDANLSDLERGRVRRLVNYHLPAPGPGLVERGLEHGGVRRRSR